MDQKWTCGFVHTVNDIISYFFSASVVARMTELDSRDINREKSRAQTVKGTLQFLHIVESLKVGRPVDGGGGYLAMLVEDPNSKIGTLHAISLLILTHPFSFIFIPILPKYKTTKKTSARSERDGSIMELNLPNQLRIICTGWASWLC